MRNSKKQKNLVKVPRGSVSLHNNVKDRLSLKKGLQLAKDLGLKRVDDGGVPAGAVIRIIAPTQPRGPLTRVNGMTGKVVGFKEKGGNELVIVDVNVGGRNAKHYVPYSYICLLD